MRPGLLSDVSLWKLSVLGCIAKANDHGRGPSITEVSPHHRWIPKALIEQGLAKNVGRRPTRYELVVTDEGRAILKEFEW